MGYADFLDLPDHLLLHLNDLTLSVHLLLKSPNCHPVSLYPFLAGDNPLSRVSDDVAHPSLTFCACNTRARAVSRIGNILALIAASSASSSAPGSYGPV